MLFVPARLIRYSRYGCSELMRHYLIFSFCSSWELSLPNSHLFFSSLALTLTCNLFFRPGSFGFQGEKLLRVVFSSLLPFPQKTIALEWQIATFGMHILVSYVVQSGKRSIFNGFFFTQWVSSVWGCLLSILLLVYIVHSVLWYFHRHSLCPRSLSSLKQAA